MMHAFGYGLFYASVGVLLLPQEALHMFEEQHAIFLAVMLALAGVSQLVSPAAGYMSDRTCHWMGRRMPYILLGNLTLFLCLGAMFLARTYLYGYTYLALLLAAVISLNVAYTGFTGLVSDVVPLTQMGFASGVMGAMTAAGAVTGLVFLGWLGEQRLDLAYGVYAAAVFFCTPFTYFAVRDKPLSREDSKVSSAAELWKSYWISPASHGDFFWVFVSRTFYYMAVSVQIYILYYLRDTMKEAEIKNNAQKYTAILCVISQGASGIVAAIAGSWCDSFGRKPLIYLSCLVMAMVYVGYCFIDTYPWVIALGLCYGSSNGVYLAVDYALAVECLPNQDDHAKDLALWSLPIATPPSHANRSHHPVSTSGGARGGGSRLRAPRRRTVLKLPRATRAGSNAGEQRLRDLCTRVYQRYMYTGAYRRYTITKVHRRYINTGVYPVFFSFMPLDLP